MKKIAIVDYGMGNLHSVHKSVQVAAQWADTPIDAFLTNQPEHIIQADQVIFPGQGAMPDCMASLRRSGLAEAILESVKNKPFFGICVGAQLLFDDSEEGNTQGLGLFSGSVRRFADHLCDQNHNVLKVPHMGWNTVHQQQPHPLFSGIAQDARFYFVHSYYFAPQKEVDILATSEYPNDFACIIGRDNVFATQFHTEKSHDNGLMLMKNFLLWDGTV